MAIIKCVREVYFGVKVGDTFEVPDDVEAVSPGFEIVRGDPPPPADPPADPPAAPADEAPKDGE